MAALTILALALRCWALTWGAPNAARYYLYHPDEPDVLDAACRVNPLLGEVAPHFYHYGSLTILLARLVHDLLLPVQGWGGVPRFDQPFAAWVGDFARLLLVGRWITVLFGAATVPVTYKLGERLYGPRAGWLAAAFLAVAPGAVVFGRCFTVDVPAAFFTTLTLLFAALALREPGARRAAGWLIAAGAAAGLAGGTKYNCVLALAGTVPAILRLWRGDDGKRTRGAALLNVKMLVACAAAFLISTPGALLETGVFLRNFSYELARSAEGQGLLFKGLPPASLYHLGVSLPVTLEWPLYLLSLAGVGHALRRRTASDGVLLLFLLAFFLPLAASQRSFLRYVLPMLPPLAVLAARAVDEGLRTPRRAVWTAAAAIAGAAAFASTVAHLGVLSLPDARDQAADYLRRTSRPGDVVALASDAWFYTPPLDPTAGCVKAGAAYGGPPIWDQVRDGAPRPDLCRLDGCTVLAPRSYAAFQTAEGVRYKPASEGALPVEKLRRYHPRRVVISDFEDEDAKRLRRQDPSFSHPILDLEAEMRTEGYHVEKEFRPRPSLLGFTWWRSGVPPTDWRYDMPTVRVYVGD